VAIVKAISLLGSTGSIGTQTLLWQVIPIVSGCGTRRSNLRLTPPVPSVNAQSAKLITLTIRLANQSTPTDTTLRGL